MKQPTTVQVNAPRPGHGLVSKLAFFAAGLLLSAGWFFRPVPPASAPVVPPASTLTPATLAVLQQLPAPVELRFYSLLDSPTVSDSVRDFSPRVDELLSRYEQAAGGKIRITRVNINSSAAANAALADGITPFNMDRGEACYLGVAVVCNLQKQTLPALAPAWEPALESDLSRALAAVAAASVQSQPPVKKSDAAALAAVLRALPNLESVSLDEGSRLLRTAAVNEFQTTALELRDKVKAAEDALLQAQNSGGDQEAALKNLEQAQKDQTEKLSQIALNSKAQLEALQQLKAAHP